MGQWFWLFGVLVLTEGVCAGAAGLSPALPSPASPVWAGVRLVGYVLLATWGSRLIGGMRGERERPMKILEDLALKAGRPREIQATLDAGVLQVCRLLFARTACLRLLDARGDLVLTSSLNAHPAHLEDAQRVTPRSRDLQLALRAGEPAVLAGKALDPELRNRLSHHRGGPVFGLVLAADGRAQGLLIVQARRKDRPNPETLRILRTIAAILATAIAAARTYQALLEESQTDPLTGVGSRRHFEEHYRREMARSARNGQPICLAMVDVDCMKGINDTWGHLAGDRVLEALGRMLRNVRTDDVVARYGGDEFVVLMPDTTFEDAQHAIRRIRARLQRLNDAQAFPFPITLSIGLADGRPGDEDLLARADAAMYLEKRRHLNAVSSNSRTGEGVLRLVTAVERPENLN